jgi:Na+/melibiose symporter-like transporter
MSSFWQDAYNDDKDRRYGALFFTTLLGCFLSLVIGGVFAAITESDFFDGYGQVMLIIGVVIVLVLVLLAIRFIRVRRRRKVDLKYSALSRDELAKARSKLKTKMQPVTFRRESRPPRRPPPRKPDVDLKY